MCIMHDHPLARKGDVWIPLHIEEICRAKMLIPLGIMGIHTCRFNLDINFRTHDVLFIEFHGTAKLLKCSPDRRYHQMSAGKADVSMSRVKLPTHHVSPFCLLVVIMSLPQGRSSIYCCVAYHCIYNY